MVIVEVVKSYRDVVLAADKKPGDLFKTDPERAARLVEAEVAKVLFDDEAKEETKPKKKSK